jgi:hypothetical protein
MKEYPLTDSDIETLGMTKGGSTFFFAVGSVLVGFISNHVSATTWDAFTASLGTPIYAAALGATVVCFLAGGYLWYRNGSTIRRIKDEVKFDS